MEISGGKIMKFRSNARYEELLENGTVFDLNGSKLRICIHRLVGIQDEWFLDCAALRLSNVDLQEKEFDKAVNKSKSIIGNKIKELQEEFNKIADDTLIEFE